jgi:hypothetical protein
MEQLTQVAVVVVLEMALLLQEVMEVQALLY